MIDIERFCRIGGIGRASVFFVEDLVFSIVISFTFGIAIGAAVMVTL